MNQITKPGIVNANFIYKKLNQDAIDIITSDHVKSIDMKILSALEHKQNCISYDLPTTFSVNNMSRADAQLLVYSNLLEMYNKPQSEGGAGLTAVLYDENTNRPKLYITWLSALSPDEKSRRLDIVRKYTKK